MYGSVSNGLVWGIFMKKLLLILVLSSSICFAGCSANREIGTAAGGTYGFVFGLAAAGFGGFGPVGGIACIACGTAIGAMVGNTAGICSDAIIPMISSVPSTLGDQEIPCIYHAN